MKYMPRIVIAAVLLAAGPAMAEVPGTQGLGGPAVEGVCLLGREAVFANAEIGKSATAQIARLTEQAQAEVDAERTPLESEAKGFEAQRGQLTAEDYEKKQRALAGRWEVLQQKAAHRGREIEATRVKALERISNEAQPVIAAVYKSRNCGLLLDRGVALGGNLSGDLTESVVLELDRKIKTISIQREVLPYAPMATGASGR